MTVPPRLLAVASLALGAVLAMSSCGGEVRPGAAAIVGDTRISAAQLEQVVDRSLADPAASRQFADRAAFQRQELAQLIRREVLAVALADNGIVVTDGQVDERLRQFEDQVGGTRALREQAAQNAVAEPDLRDYIRDIVRTEALGDRLVANEQVDQATLQALYQQNLAAFDQVHTAHILVRDKALADSLLAQVRADPSRFAALAAQHSADESNKNRGGDLGFTGRGRFVKPFEDAAFSAQPGTFTQAQTDFGFHVIHVIERRTTDLAAAVPQLRRQALRDQREARISEVLSATAARLGVTVNPRFGTYKADTGTVEPPADEVSKPAQSAPAEGGPAGGAPAPAPSGSPGR